MLAYAPSTEAQRPRAAMSRASSVDCGLPGALGTWPEMACLGTRLFSRPWVAGPSAVRTRASWLEEIWHGAEKLAAKGGQARLKR